MRFWLTLHAVELVIHSFSAEQALSLFRPPALCRGVIFPTVNNWASLESEMRRVLRLRHTSLRTERSYLGWLQRFRVFVGARTIEPALVVQFLSSLPRRPRRTRENWLHLPGPKPENPHFAWNHCRSDVEAKRRPRSRPCESGIRRFMQSMTECCMCESILPALPDGELPRHLCS
jgi:hypothetical protein